MDVCIRGLGHALRYGRMGLGGRATVEVAAVIGDARGVWNMAEKDNGYKS